MSVDFVASTSVIDSEEGIFAAGCFWGVEHYFKQLIGVLKTEAGYIGGKKNHPTYQDVCEGNTGYLEAVRIIYDPSQINYQSVAKYFFEIHDPTQFNGQGPDLGEQYLSAIFCYDKQQYQIAAALITELENKQLSIATQLKPMSIFWKAETYHQDYYQKTGKHPYCHQYTKRF